MCSSTAHGANDGNDNDSAIDSSGPSLEVDSDDRDSALGDNQSTYTMSATSSVYNFKFENGRRYHAYSEGKYPIPNDEIEKDRLDLQHQAFRLTLDGKLFSAPLPPGIQHVLDVGCGTGIWTIEFADDHPSANVIGTDLSPIQPTSVPPNCSFLIDDCDQEWIFHDKFDYIHTRAMVAALKDWDRFFQQAYANLKPGGYIECQEITFPMLCHDRKVTSADSPVLRWSELFIQAAATTGLDATAPNYLGPKLRAAGFVDVHAKCYKWPVGRWARGAKMKLLGYYVYEDVMDWMPASAMGLFTRVLKWSRDEVELFLADCRRDLKERNNRHFYANAYFWVARKPEEAELSNLGNQEDVRDVDQLSADDDSQGATAQEQTVAGTEADPASSTGALVDPTADLSIRSSSSQEKDIVPSLPPTASSDSRTSFLTMDEMLNPAPTSSATTAGSSDPAPAASSFENDSAAPVPVTQFGTASEDIVIPASSTSAPDVQKSVPAIASAENALPAPNVRSDVTTQDENSRAPAASTQTKNVTGQGDTLIFSTVNDVPEPPLQSSAEMATQDYSDISATTPVLKEAEASIEEGAHEQQEGRT